MILTKKMVHQLILSIGLIFMVSCDDSASNVTEQDTVPEVPPANSMAMDFSIFNSSEANSDTTGSQENYEEAAQKISDLQSIMSRNVNPSLNLLNQADTTEAEQLDNKKWQWEFANDAEEGRLIYEVRLVAEQQSNDELTWDIFLSSPILEKEELHYISGTSNREINEGVWTYHGFGRAGQPSQELAELDWQLIEDQDIEIALTILADNAYNGSQVSYHTEGPVRIITLDNTNGSGTITIEYNTETKTGFIQSPDFNEGEKACWDSGFNNIACSEI